MGCNGFVCKKEDGSLKCALIIANSIKSPLRIRILSLGLMTCLINSKEKYSHKFELRSVYHQQRVRGEYIQKMTFPIIFGYYEFLVMSFGLTNTMGEFMDLMNRVF